MNVTVNGEVRVVSAGTTMAKLLGELGYRTKFCAVERNRELVPRAEHADCALAEGDELEIVTLVGGG